MLESPQPVKKYTFSIGGRGWYKIPGWRDGDRTLEQQVWGLTPLVPQAVDPDTGPVAGSGDGLLVGKSTLELGAAEGLMSKWFVDVCGATSVHGVEIIEGHVELGRKWCKKRPIKLTVANCDTWRPKQAYDVVVALALLHKLQDPLGCLAAVAEAAKEMVVVRLPSACEPWVITDARTEFKPWDVDRCLRQNGFDLVNSTMGPFNEPTGFWRRK
jgi:Methyltransferase domain